MNLIGYTQGLSPKDRAEFKIKFCAAHDIDAATYYRWLQRHPALHDRLKITESLTNYEVTRFDLLPDIFDKKDLVNLMKRLGDANE